MSSRWRGKSKSDPHVSAYLPARPIKRDKWIRYYLMLSDNSYGSECEPGQVIRNPFEEVLLERS